MPPRPRRASSESGASVERLVEGGEPPGQILQIAQDVAAADQSFDAVGVYGQGAVDRLKPFRRPVQLRKAAAKDNPPLDVLRVQCDRALADFRRFVEAILAEERHCQVGDNRDAVGKQPESAAEPFFRLLVVTPVELVERRKEQRFCFVFGVRHPAFPVFSAAFRAGTLGGAAPNVSRPSAGWGGKARSPASAP